MTKTALKGAAFEYFVRKIMLSCGFKPVISDGFLIYNSGPGQMIHGLGQPHNADVLLEPHIQTPFYNSSRLIIECKCYDEALGIEFVRNVLGLRTDINSFDIVTPDILDNRKNYRSSKPKIYDIQRYNYQVALASFSGYKHTAAALATTHKIPLISFASSIFHSIKTLIFTLDSFNLTQQETTILNDFFHDRTNQIHRLYNSYLSQQFRDWFSAFINEVENLASNLSVGITNSGAILFLYNYNDLFNYIRNQYNEHQDGFQLHWNDENKYWLLHDSERCFIFELPEAILSEWSDNAETIDKREAALGIKEKAMSNIVLYKIVDNKPKIEILQLSRNFIENARRKLNEDKE